MSEYMDTGASQTRPELIEVADTVARDKGIEREEVLEAMEQAIQKAGRSKYGHEHDIRASIDRSTGEIALARYVEVVESPEDVENEITQIDAASAKKKEKTPRPVIFWSMPCRPSTSDALPPRPPNR